MYSIALADIEREQNTARFWPGFSAKIEALYRAEIASDQRKAAGSLLLAGLLLSDLFVVSDYFVAGDDFLLYAVGRLGVMTPISLALIFLLFFQNKARYDLLVCAMPCIMSAVFSALLIMSEGSYRSNYLFGNTLLIICGCVAGRPSLLAAVFSVIFQSICYHVVVFASDVVPQNERVFSSLFGISGAIVSILTLYMLEKTGRRAFLSNLRARMLNRQLEILTLMDPLTGIGNRRSFENETQRFWDGKHGDRLASIILIDIDHFKLFNDHYGHPEGDLCLKNIAACIAGQTDPLYKASRFGGEEFVVFLPDADLTTARQVAESIRVAIANARIPHPVVSAHPIVSVSLGVATSLVRDCSATDLVSFADTALYAAKRNGRNQVWPPLAAAATSLGSTTETAMHSVA